MRSATKTARLLRQLSGDRGRDGSSDGNHRGRAAVSSPGLRTSPQRWRGYRTWLRNAMPARPGSRRREVGR
jgi:hypothetical protein